MSEGWKYILAASSDMGVIGELRKAKNRTLTVDNNKSGAAGFSLPIENQFAGSIIPWKTCLIAQRDDEAIWSGPISTVNADLAGGQITVNALGWFELLIRRLIKVLVTYSAQDAGAVAAALLAIANAQANTYITMGTSEATQLRDRTYEVDASIGQEIQALADLEAGYDWYIDPLSRLFNIVARRGQDRPECKWLFIADDAGANKGNCKNVLVDLDGTTVVNDMYPRGKNGISGHAEDLTSQSEYGLHMEAPSLSDVSDVDILNAFGEAEMVYRKDPRQTFTVLPKVSNADGVPKIFEDYDIGDTTYLTARRGYVDINDQAIRIFGADLSIDEEGVETVTRLQTTNA